MVTVPAPNPLNGEFLRTELAAVGVAIGEFDFTRDGDTLTFPTVDDSQQATVEQVVAAHAGEAPPRVRNRATLETAVLDHLADLRTIRNSTGTLTGAQLSNAVRALAKGQAHVIRLLIGALDSTD